MHWEFSAVGHTWIKYDTYRFRITFAHSQLMSYDKRHDEVSAKGKYGN